MALVIIDRILANNSTIKLRLSTTDKKTLPARDISLISMDFASKYVSISHPLHFFIIFTRII